MEASDWLRELGYPRRLASDWSRDLMRCRNVVGFFPQVRFLDHEVILHDLEVILEGWFLIG